MRKIKPDLRWQNLSLMEFLRQSTTINYAWTDQVSIPKIVPEKELTEKQLFTKLKKELKEIVNRTSAI
jgi:hypothetical protein